MFLDCRRKAEKLEKTHTDTGKHANSTQQKPELESNPGLTVKLQHQKGIMSEVGFEPTPPGETAT